MRQKDLKVSQWRQVGIRYGKTAKDTESAQSCAQQRAISGGSDMCWDTGLCGHIFFPFYVFTTSRLATQQHARVLARMLTAFPCHPPARDNDNNGKGLMQRGRQGCVRASAKPTCSETSSCVSSSISWMAVMALTPPCGAFASIWL